MIYQAIADTSGQDLLLKKSGVQPKTLGIMTLIGGLVAAMAWSFYYFYSTSEVDEIVVEGELHFATVERGDFLKDLLAQGRVITANSPTLFSPEQGFVQLKVKAGDRVMEGQLLVEVVSPGLEEHLAREQALLLKLNAEVERKKLEIKRRIFGLQKMEDMAKVNLEALEREKKRSDKLIEKQIISQMNYEKIVDNRDRAALELRLAKKTNSIDQESLAFEQTMVEQDVSSQKLVVDSVQKRLDRLKIRSPVTGMVGSLQVKDQQAIGGYHPLITVVDLTHYEMEAPVPEDYADDLAPGMKVEIKLNKKIFWGELLAVSPEVIHSQVTTRVGFKAPYPENLRENQRLSVRIFIQEKADVLMVERGSFTDSFEGSVFVRVGDKAHRRKIKLGDRSYSSIEILDGLSVGEVIINSATGIRRKTNVVLIKD